MRAVIAGGGGTGVALAKLLMEDGWSVVIIDRDPRVCEHIVRELPSVDVIEGEATDPKVLEEAGIRKADVFVAVTNSDSVNVMSSVLAKNMGVKKVIARVESSMYKEVAEKMGLKDYIIPSESAAAQIEEMVKGVDFLSTFIKYHRELELLEEEVDKSSPYVGMSICEVMERNNDRHPIMIIKSNGDKVLIPKLGYRIKAGDKIIFLRKRSIFERLF